MNLVNAVNDSWAWTGISINRIRAQSPMGHLVVSDREEQFFYLDPDGMAVIALGSNDQAQTHLRTDEAKELWFGGELYSKALERLGEPPQGYVLNLELPAMIEGRYSPENMWTWPLEELIRVTGDVARQISDLPDGAQVELEVTD
ncbi:hypothetical protein NAP1_10283 [Erythrobacter sp. NAP1]|uniref:hypothetical protein n=1 Tax=Erythrobacter sp. NAP1 TaxID=237727 RepID=UPI00006875BD|nr:hypothetical protein [Erythrobacter sp. NAP1]EAQ27974.1 hypothetical protein NAP1_10283 [Erythrobacter sp. NAP1]